MNKLVKEFLLKYGYIILFDTNSDTISNALKTIVSNQATLNGYHNLYELDMRECWWEWQLHSEDHPEKQQINRITTAQRINHQLYKDNL